MTTTAATPSTTRTRRAPTPAAAPAGAPGTTRAAGMAGPAGQARLVVETPLGAMLLAGDAGALTHLFLPNAGLAGLGTSAGRTPPPLREAARQLDQYFAGRRRTFDVPLRPSGTPFQTTVWWTLASIPFGDTVTYGELARRAGRPGAFRAVGQANGANPLPILLPCHRVVAAGGRLGGYGGGLAIKRRLLALEGSALADAP